MSHGKRIRKARNAARREKRFAKAIASAHVTHADAIERARVRAEINASDAPAAWKTVLGFLVDPIGAVAEAATRKNVERTKGSHEEGKNEDVARR